MENTEKHLTPIKAIRAKCLDCCCGSAHEVKLCVCTDCSLYPYRMGKNPFIDRKPLSEEQKEAQKERLAKMREARNRNKNFEE